MPDRAQEAPHDAPEAEAREFAAQRRMSASRIMFRG